MTTSTTISTKNLVREESLQFIRKQQLRLSLKNARPNTRLYVFFDEEEVTQYCKLNDGNTTLVTNNNGECEILFTIPSGKFSVGKKQIIVADTNEKDLINIPGTVNGSARAVFNASGKIQFYQETQVTTIKKEKTPVNPPTPTPTKKRSFQGGGGGGGNDTFIKVIDHADIPGLERDLLARGLSREDIRGKGINLLNLARDTGSSRTNLDGKALIDFFENKIKDCKVKDPIAQSFFTYKIDGGFFLSSIDLYFRTKDDSAPVWIEIREMINGLPDDLHQNNPTLVSIITADEIETSENASLATNFRFSPPVYIPEDKDYCFVVLSNSNKYNIFTSKMGERSIENNQIIFENPFVGSVFKSENNITWTAEQFEDMKFTIYRAVFDNTSEGSIIFGSDVPQIIANGENFTTTANSSIITYIHNNEHGLESGSKISINALNHGEYNGISGNALTGDFIILSTPDRKTVTFDCGANASISGPIISANTIVSLKIQNPGSNYDSNTTLSFSTGNATANAIVSDGKLIRADIINPGNNYFVNPSVTVNSMSGTGAVVTALTDAIFTVGVNKPMTHFTPKIEIFNFRDTTVQNKLRTTIGNYEGGNLVTYNLGKELIYSEKDELIPIEQNSLIASRWNENYLMSDLESAKVTINLQTDSKYQSPIIDFRKQPEIEAISVVINNQSGEDLNSNNTTASIQSIVITNGGTGYTATPNVLIIGNGANATANAVISSGSVTTINLLTAGDSFKNVPQIQIVRHPSDTTGTGAAAQAILTPFNTELLPKGGNAKSKYITRRFSLETISTGIRLYANINSGRNSSVDWYFRGSLSSAGVSHDELNWIRMICDVPRNKSQNNKEIYEYEFYLNGLSEFDVYDLKCVMLASNPLDYPTIHKFSAVAIA